MKKWISAFLILALLTAPAASLAAGKWWENIGPEKTSEPTPAPTPEPTPEPTAAIEEPCPATFAEDISRLTSRAYGGVLDCAHVGDWWVMRGYMDDNYRFFAQKDQTYSTKALTDIDPICFVPAGDSILYYGEVSAGEYGWVIQNPAKATVKALPLGYEAEIFCADEQYIYYYTYAEDQTERCTLRRMDYQGEEKEKIATIDGSIVTRMEDGSLLLFNVGKNAVALWKDGGYETVYAPKEEIVSVMGSGREIWVEHSGYFGLLRDGEFALRIEGNIMTIGSTTDQTVVLVRKPDDSVNYHAMIFNDVYEAYATIGTVAASDGIVIELMPNESGVTLWSPVQSRDYYIPAADQWLPYVKEARPEPAVSGPAATAEPEKKRGAGGLRDLLGGLLPKDDPKQDDPKQDVPAGEPYAGDDMVTVTIPAGLTPLDEGISAPGIENRDDSLTYMMSPKQRDTHLALRRQAVFDLLEDMTTKEPYSDVVLSYNADNLFQEVALTVRKDKWEGSEAQRAFEALTRLAPAVQLLADPDADCRTVFELWDIETRVVFKSFTVPEA